MKKILKSFVINLLLFVLVFTGMYNINGNRSDVHQYNYNPEKTNDWKLYSYQLGLDSGRYEEEYVFIDIVEYNNLTNQGVEDLVNYGYLHSYIPALIEAGRLPEGFTPVSSKPEESTPESEKPSEPETPNNPQAPDSEQTEENIAPPQEQKPENTQKPNEPTNNTPSNTAQNTPAQNKTEPDNSEKKPDTASITCDDTITGTYVVISENTKSYSSYSVSSDTVSEFPIGSKINVTGLTSNGFYRAVVSEKEQYIKKENLIDQASYDAAWKEVAKTESTCQAEGSIIYTNEITAETNLVITNKADHKMKLTEKQPPSCEENGYETLLCTVCGEKEKNELPASGHAEGKFKTLKKGGIFTTGLKESRCLVCDKVIKTETIPAKIPLAAVSLCVLFIGLCFVLFIVTRNKIK